MFLLVNQQSRQAILSRDVEDFQSYLVADTEDERMINDGL